MITPQLCLQEGEFANAKLWVKKVGNAHLIFQNKAPSAKALTEMNWPTYEIKLYRGAQLNDDFPVDHHRFVFINDAKAGFRRFIHESELYSRTTGNPEKLKVLYERDKGDEDNGRAFFPLWHEDGQISPRERMPRGWTASSKSSHDLNIEEETDKPRLLAQSLIWCRTSPHLSGSLR